MIWLTAKIILFRFCQNNHQMDLVTVAFEAGVVEVVVVA
jgi:hypothetical protein